MAVHGFTLEQFLALPERKPALEYVDGVVTQKAWPSTSHSALQGWWLRRVAMFAWQRLALPFSELLVVFAGRAYVPDVSVFRWERLPPATPDGDWIDDVTYPPDLVVEIVSPKQSVTKLIRRSVWYVANGVRVAVLVDPDDKTVMMFRSGHEQRLVRGDQPLGLDDVLPGFGATAADLVQALRRPD